MVQRFERRSIAKQLSIDPASSELHIPTHRLDWGDYFDLTIGPLDSMSTTWSAFFLLAGLEGPIPLSATDMNAVRIHDVEQGSSNYKIHEDMTEPRLAVMGIPEPVVLRRRRDHTLAAIEIARFEAPNADQASIVARTYFNLIAAYLAFAFDVPIRMAAMHVLSLSDNKEVFRLFMPWAIPEFTPFSLQQPGGVATRLLLMYSEGVISNSHAYRFLCFYKIVDHVLSVGGPALRKLRRDTFPEAPWHEFNDIMPNDPIAQYDLDLVGQKYTAARDRYQKTQLRNAAAHVLSNEITFEPLDPADAAHYRAGAAVFRFIGHHLIRLTTLNCQALVDAGAEPATLLTLFYPERGLARA